MWLSFPYTNTLICLRLSAYVHPRHITGLMGLMQAAVEGQLWGVALMLARQCGNGALAETATAMTMACLHPGTPLSTALLIMAGRPDLVHEGEWLLIMAGHPDLVHEGEWLLIMAA